jgi:hypothetical protein
MIYIDEGEQLANFYDMRGFIWEAKVSTDIDHFPPGTRLNMPCILVALMAQYINVRQRKLDIIHTVHILQHDSADTGSQPERNFCMVNSNYFQ